LGGVSFFLEVLPLLKVVLELLLFCLENCCQRFGVRLGRVGLGFRLVGGRSGSGVFMGNFCLSFPVMGIHGLGKDAETREVVQLVVVNHVILDVFCKTVLSLLMECCITPLNLCG